MLAASERRAGSAVDTYRGDIHDLTRLTLATAAGAAAHAVAAPVAGAAPVAPSAATKVWTAGTYTPGKKLDVLATCAPKGKTAATKSTVTGPRGIKGTLLPATKGDTTLKGSVTVPKTMQGSWIRLWLTCSNGATAKVVVNKTGAKPAPAPKPAPTPAPTQTTKALKAWTTGSLKPGATITVFAENALDVKGKPATTATTTGPRGTKVTLKPVKGKTYLQGTYTVPKTLTGSWIRLNVVDPAGHVVTVTVKR